jgi:hypothetical protein
MQRKVGREENVSERKHQQLFTVSNCLRSVSAQRSVALDINLKRFQLSLKTRIFEISFAEALANNYTVAFSIMDRSFLYLPPHSMPNSASIPSAITVTARLITYFDRFRRRHRC